MLLRFHLARRLLGAKLRHTRRTLMNIMVLGSGGREAALAQKLNESESCDELYCVPGNGGTALFANNVADVDPCDGAAVVAFASEHGVELVVVGPEAPLVAGVADAVRAAGIACFGPGAQGAQMEGSKEFAKKLMAKYDIPTAAYASFTSLEPAEEYIKEQGAPIVIKADGLAAGKGVTVATTVEQAVEAVRDCFDGAFGDAGASVVIEECMTGPECSIMGITDGKTVLCCQPAQDHKRAYDGDEGPNTGGMGVYSPVPIVTPEEQAAMTKIMEQTVTALAAEGIDYRGCLYGGFMLTPTGPRVVEFNARFGDPETQVLMPRLESDLVDVMMAVDAGKLEDVQLQWTDAFCVGVVLASDGYPGSYEKRKPVTGIEAAEQNGAHVYHAGTVVDGGQLLTNGGRVFCVSALGSTFQEARDKAYEACDKVSFSNKFMRSDIGARALRGREAWD